MLRHRVVSSEDIERHPHKSLLARDYLNTVAVSRAVLELSTHEPDPVGDAVNLFAEYEALSWWRKCWVWLVQSW